MGAGLQGTVALVTGASSGIGEATATALAGPGAAGHSSQQRRRAAAGIVPGRTGLGLGAHGAAQPAGLAVLRARGAAPLAAGRPGWSPRGRGPGERQLPVRPDRPQELGGL